MAAEEIFFPMVSLLQTLIPGEMLSSNRRVYVDEWKNIFDEHPLHRPARHLQSVQFIVSHPCHISQFGLVQCRGTKSTDKSLSAVHCTGTQKRWEIPCSKGTL